MNTYIYIYTHVYTHIHVVTSGRGREQDHDHHDLPVAYEDGVLLHEIWRIAIRQITCNKHKYEQ